MSNKNHSLIYEKFKEMYDLKVEREVYKNIVIEATVNSAACKLTDYHDGVEAWETIKKYYTNKIEIAGQRIKDIYAECERLKKEGEES